MSCGKGQYGPAAKSCKVISSLVACVSVFPPVELPALHSTGLLLLQVLRRGQSAPRVFLVGAQPTRLKQAETLGAEMVPRDGSRVNIMW